MHAMRDPSGCSGPLKGCLIVVAIVIIVLIVLLIQLYRTPTVQDINECRSNMVEIGAALDRYEDVNGHYPERLSDLKEEYLKDTDVLKCPRDKSKSTEVSYTYFMPDKDSPDDFIVLTCDRHRIMKNEPKKVLVLYLDGSFDMIDIKDLEKDDN